MRNECKYNTMEIHQTAWEEKKKEKERNYKTTARKQLTKWY